MKKPVIGISGSVIIDGGGNFPGYRRSYVNEDYVYSVIKNGGIPYIIPFNEDEEVIRMQMEHVDGLILSGGHDVTPRFYGQEPLIKLGGVYPERDTFDFRLLENAVKAGKPVLGICRGFQVINAYFKGTIFQDLSFKEGVKVKHDQVHTPSMTSHSIKINEGTLLHELFKKDTTYVNSFHHQILDKVAEGFTVGAMSTDGVVEAIENKEKNILAVQWHPEMLHRSTPEMNVLFSDLIEKAGK